MLFISLKSISQTNPRMVNENYMYTAFYEGFDGATLDRNVWNVSHNGKKDSGLNIWVDNTNLVNQTNGGLDLSQLYSPGYTTTTWDGKVITADYISGEVTSNATFLYGSFECRAKYANQRGSWPAFWLFGGDGVPCPPGGNACEIDISEYWNVTNMNLLGECNTVNKLENNCHLYYPPDVCGTSKFYHFYSASMGSSMDNNFHVYKCVWTPDKIDFYMDNVLKNTLLKASYPIEFPYLAMQAKLSQQVPTLPCSYITCPQTSSFDYVKAKQFFLAPEITLSSNIICSTAPATLDVDPLATNITWQLTPSNLFSGATSGTGKVVNITASPSYHGKGKITYSFNISTDIANPKQTYTAEKEIWINGPDASEVSFDVYKSDGTHVTNSSGYTPSLCANTTYHIYVMNSSPCSTSNYSWTIPSGWTNFYTLSNMISINTNSASGGNVRVSANTSCNNNVVIISGYMSSGSCGGYYLAISPNPTTSETSVVLSADGEKVVNENTSWDLQVYDQQQGLKEKKTKIKGKDGKINTSSWKDGVYIINAIVDGQKISEKLLVKH